MMREKFDKILAKKGKKISPAEQKAKGDVLSDLHGQASDAMGDKLMKMKKVSVMSPDKSGLEDGLDKAKELLNNVPDDTDDNNYQAVEGHGNAHDEDPGTSEEHEGGPVYPPELHHQEESMVGDEDKHDLEEKLEPEHNMSEEDIDRKIDLLNQLKAKMRKPQSEDGE